MGVRVFCLQCKQRAKCYRLSRCLHYTFSFVRSSDVFLVRVVHTWSFDGIIVVPIAIVLSVHTALLLDMYSVIVPGLEVVCSPR